MKRQTVWEQIQHDLEQIQNLSVATRENFQREIRAIDSDSLGREVWADVSSPVIAHSTSRNFG